MHTARNTLRCEWSSVIVKLNCPAACRAWLPLAALARGRLSRSEVHAAGCPPPHRGILGGHWQRSLLLGWTSPKPP
jgi:hypothetical protein